MPDNVKQDFLRAARERLGKLDRLLGSRSLYQAGAGPILYIRYSKLHDRGQTFYGLRQQDLQRLEGFPSYLCFLWPQQEEPLLVPFADFEEVIKSTEPAVDGQYKAQVYLTQGAIELYIAQAGRFSVEGHLGWDNLEQNIETAGDEAIDLSHSQVQTLLGSIGATNGLGVWVPPTDRTGLDWSITRRFDCWRRLPPGLDAISSSLEDVDVIWLRRGSNELHSLFEIEHSTPVYSGLLRLNDVLLLTPQKRSEFHIVANEARRELFARQVNRPTFRASGLNRVCSFLQYKNVVGWHQRVASRCSE